MIVAAVVLLGLAALVPDDDDPTDVAANDSTVAAAPTTTTSVPATTAPAPTTTTSVPATTAPAPVAAAAGSATTIDPDVQAIADGNVALCNDGGYSDNTDFGATCSGGDGINYWLASYVQCNDGAIGPLNGGQSCGGRGGVKQLMPSDYTPPTTAPPTLEESLASIVAKNVTGDVLGVTAESPTVVVTIRSSESFTEGLTKDSARFAVASALEAVQGADLPPDITEVVVVIRFELVNQYGEVSEESVIVARFTRGTLDRIVFDSIDPRQILLLAEGDLSVHPAFRKGDGS